MNTIYVALFLISAATLAFQVVLTRFFALAQGHHLAFMAVSLALLGAGASGTYLSLKQPERVDLPQLLTAGLTLFTLSVPAAYITINYLPFDAYRLALERSQLGWLILYYLALTTPFFFSGLAIGAALVVQPGQAGALYAANLLGSALGPPLALLSLATLGGPGTVFLCALLGWLAVTVTSREAAIKREEAKRRGGEGEQGSSRAEEQKNMATKPHVSERSLPLRRLTFQHAASPWNLSRFFAYAAVTILLLYFAFRPPAFFDVRLTPYKSLSQALLYPGSEVIFRQWNAFSRVDVIRSSGVRSAPGLSFAYSGELPPQLGLLVDGDNLSPISKPVQPIVTQYLPLTLAFELRPTAKVLILEPGGGLAVLTALNSGAQSVTVVQSNPTVVAAISRHFADFNGNLYGDPRITVVIDEPRSFLRRTTQQFDLIILPLTDSFRPVTAGAYTLNEDYRYTVESFADALTHLSPNGLLIVERWLQLPPSESLRLWGIAITALHQWDNHSGHSLPSHRGLWPQRPESLASPAGTSSALGPAATGGQSITPATHLLAIRSLQTSLVGVARSPLLKEDLALLRQFATERQFDLIWLPDIQPEETNRFSLVPGDPYHRTFAKLLTTPNPASFFAAYPYAVAPPTDDHPFFFHFFKWQQTPAILQSLGKTWQPFGGSGYLVLVVLLALVVVLSAGLILLPLLANHKGRRLKNEDQKSSSFILAGRSALGSPSSVLLYFALLGLGFLFVEIPLLQRFILYLGQPAYSFAIVISALLVAAGVGSGYLSPKLSLRLVLPLIAFLAIIYPLLLPYLFNATLRLPFAGRVLITIFSLFPLGTLLGVPFPRALTLVAQTSPQLIPWVWAVNGCASVISAVLAAMIALTWSFSVVLWSAALAYGLAGLIIGVRGGGLESRYALTPEH